MKTNLKDLPRLAARPKATESDVFVRFEKEDAPVLDSVRALDGDLFRQPNENLIIGQVAPSIDESRNLGITPELERQAKVIVGPEPESKALRGQKVRGIHSRFVLLDVHYRAV